MTAAMAHRGPDGCRVWQSGAVGLGHCAMHTTPEAHYERQPETDATGRLAITADARIDNRDALRRRLRPAAPGGVVTDAALILAAYEKWGVDCCRHLIGDFAFAIWDASRQQLVCARDPLGIRPFYYYGDPNVFAFGTEIKALLSLDAVPSRINEVRIAEYLAKTGTNPEITFYRDVLRLPPAHVLVVHRDGRTQMHRFWSLNPEHECRLPTDEAYEERFLDVFTEAVRCRLRSDAPVGVSLSGGLDSSSVACVARDLLGDTGALPLDTFSAVFPGLPDQARRQADESRYLDALEAQGGFRMHRLPLDDVSPLEDIDRALWHLDQPPFVCNVYLVNALFRAARARGVKVMLDGAEGDIAVSYGLGRLGELLLAGQWNPLAREVRALAARYGAPASSVFQARLAPFLNARAAQHPWRFATRDVHRAAALSGRPRWRLLWQHLAKPLLPPSALNAFYRLRGRKQGETPFHPIVSRDLAERTRLRERLEDERAAFRTPSYSERRRHWASLHLDAGAIAAIQEESSHLAAMCGGERRHPFYDVRLLAYCLSLPADQKLRDGWTRSILRRALKDLLPPEIRQRNDKGDLSPNFNRNLLRDEQARIRQLWADERVRLSSYIDMEVLCQAHAQRDAPTLWTAIVLTRWLHLQERRAGSKAALRSRPTAVQHVS